MALLMPLPGGRVTQHFGPSVMSIQPTMWPRDSEKAYWQWFPGADQIHLDVHAGTDFAGMVAGSPLVAAEAGKVIRAEYDKYNGGGWVIEVQIRPGVSYSYNHCQSLLRWLGTNVTKGERIATVGATGTIWTGSAFVRSTFGVHCHTVLTIREKGSDGVTRSMLHNFAWFMAGGPRASSSLVKPPSTDIRTDVANRTVKINVGVNIRSSPDLDKGDTNIAYVTREGGIYARNGTLVKDNRRMYLTHKIKNDDGEWGEFHNFDRTLYVKHGLWTEV